MYASTDYSMYHEVISGPLIRSSSALSFRRLLQGAAAGFLATAPMSLSMLIGWRLLPQQQRYHLPPRQITEEITERVGIEDHVSEEGLIGLTVLSHFGYGAVFGSIYALFEDEIRMHSSLKGMLMGIAVWIGSYLGWLPGLGILTPATQHPRGRNLLMIVAHVGWGVTLGELTRKLTTRD